MSSRRLHALILLFLALALGAGAVSAARGERLEELPPGALEALPEPFVDAAVQPVGYRNVTVPRSGGGSFTALFLYPATNVGFEAPFDPSEGPYPVVSFGHGFFQTPDRYQPTLEHLAARGYFVLAPASNVGPFPDHAEFAADLSDALTWLEEENDDSASAYFGAVDVTAFGLSGHSMGGGASILAAAADARVGAVLNMAAAETDPSAIAAMADVSVPVSLLVGSEDALVPYQSNGLIMYGNGAPPRQMPLLIGGYHCGFQDVPFPLFCDSGSMPAAAQLALTRQHLVAFFGLYLKRDQDFWPYVWGPFTLTNPLVSVLSDPGAELAPFSQTLTGPPGATLEYEITLTHTAAQPDSYRIFPAANHWSTTVSPTVTPLLTAGESVLLHISVIVPPGGGARDLLVLSARSEGDGLTRQDAYVVSRRTGSPQRTASP